VKRHVFEMCSVFLFYFDICFEMLVRFSNVPSRRPSCFCRQRDGSDKTIPSHAQRDGRQKEKLNWINTVPTYFSTYIMRLTNLCCPALGFCD